MQSTTTKIKKLSFWSFAAILMGVIFTVTAQPGLAQWQPQNQTHTHEQEYWHDEEDYQPLTPQQIYQLAFRTGFNEGREHGVEDGEDGVNFNYAHDVSYRRANVGWRQQMGYLSLYKRAFRKGYAQGYKQGYDSVDDHNNEYDYNYYRFNR